MNLNNLKIALKELRETFISLKIILKKQFPINLNNCKYLQAECDELVSIFVTSSKTADRNMKLSSRKNS
ncbi:MAG TPA: four helix bundle protein [Candidatus Marinimicrobia bacterium]|nr:four helix bundle protein [Candidatus Neomarinimicrobiota bacterium]